MENLVTIENNEVVVSSKQIAEHFEKQHKHVLDAIENIKAENSALTSMFYETTYKAGTGKNYRMYLMNRDGFSLLAMGFTGSKALEWKVKYIHAFNEMEKKLHEQAIPSEYQLKALDIKEKELSLRESELYLRIADSVSVPEYKQIMNSLAVKAVSGEMYLPLPAVNQKTYSATDIGDILGVSANKIGRLARQFNMKTPEYGKYFYDKAKYSSKELETFRYYGNAIDKFKSVLDV